MAPLFLLLAIHAPAPKPRPPLAPADLVGNWRQSWYGTTEAAVYRADGTCSYYWQGEHWEGVWRLHRTTLEVTTWRATEPPRTHLPLAHVIGPVTRTRKGFVGGQWKIERDDR